MKKTPSSARDITVASSSEWPVIAGGLGMPISSSTVGATSASIPGPARSRRAGLVTISGTGFIEWAVLGEPSGSSMWSALPWSAVTTHTPPLSWTAATTSAEAAVDGLHGPHGRLDHAGVADHVGVGEVDDPEAREVLPARRPRTRAPPRERSSAACGRRSERRAGRARARGARRARGPPRRR